MIEWLTAIELSNGAVIALCVTAFFWGATTIMYLADKRIQRLNNRTNYCNFGGPCPRRSGYDSQ